MRLETAGSVAFVALLIAIAIYMAYHPEPAPPANVSTPAPTAASGFAGFCHASHLVNKAVIDCDEMMHAATTDEERRRVERIFDMGTVKPEHKTAPAMNQGP